jgi:hypothetical protein
VSGITTFFTGEPIDFNCGVTGFSTGIGGSMGCNSIGSTKKDKVTVNDPAYGPILQYYNPANITQPLNTQLLANNQPGMFGYMGRNFITAPGRNNWDITMLKNFELPWFKGEHSNLQFRWETYNTWNHPNFGGGGGPNGGGVETGCLGTTSFGDTCTGVNNGHQIGTVVSTFNNSYRIMQFGLKFSF